MNKYMNLTAIDKDLINHYINCAIASILRNSTDSENEFIIRESYIHIDKKISYEDFEQSVNSKMRLIIK